MAPKKSPVEPVANSTLDLDELKRRRRRNSIIMALGLFAFVLFFYFLTIVKLGPELFSRAL